MKLKYYYFLARKSFFRKKINIINIFLLVVSMTMMIFISCFSKTFSNLINNQINGNINHHILIVNDSNNVNDLNMLDNIAFVADYNSFSHYVTTEKGESIILIGVPNDYLKINEGKNLNEVEEKNVMICPSEFYLGDAPEEYNKEFLNKLKDGKKLINKKFKLKSLNYEEEYKIIGLYDVNSYTYGEYNICFTKQENVANINNKEEIQLREECNSEVENCDSIGNYGTSVIIVKDVNEIDKTKSLIESKGYFVSKLVNIDTNGIDFITTFFTTLAIIVMIITFIILLVSNNKFIQYNKKNNLIYKALGYDNNILIKVNYFESIILTIISEIITILVCFVLYYYFSNIFIVEIKTGCPFLISYESIFISLLMVLIISLLSVYLSIKNNNNSIIGEFTDEEI